MKSTVEQLSPTRVKLNVEVPFEELSGDFDRAYKSLAQQIRIPGFRPGKAPAKLIEARVGRQAILEQVVNDAVPAKYSQAVTEAEIKAISQPEIDLAELVYGEPVKFTAEVDVRPEIELPEFSSIAVEVDPIEIADADVEEELDNLRGRFGTLVGVDRGVTGGDFVSLDLSATVGGETVEDASTEGLSHEVGSDTLIEGLDEALEGVKAGDSATFTSKLVAGDHAGEDAEITAKVNSVKVRELPELDDEFAQMASEFDTVDELRDSVRDRVADSKKYEQAGAIRDAVLEQLLDTVDFPLPESVVADEVEAVQHQLVHALGHDDAQVDRFLEAQGKTREEWDAESKADAEKSVRTQLLLDAIADATEVEVAQDELTQQILMQSQRYGIAPQEFIQQLQNANQIGALYADVRRNKALAEVIGEVKVTDTNGETIDTKAFFGSADDTESDEAETDEAEDA
ncbi:MULTISPECIES: trigger factor [Gordonia]|uniref:Trigger factor n=2 Tax=Gordonia TaxID=2053 RepID=L7LMG4_9ACTN|nr:MULTISPECIES: trigger factor [Gordonia]AUH69346.1 trigger factor [Gordonia sp. YC-JH1]KJR09796.1 trigger factor [Gordonia sihwensis]MBY4571730.1 trigger factor [Gordonia sihwensis]WFN94341.1 trigger factor [Gordonia sihwensis]GAC61233.1 trigger factor [Gordonia sihwensis NBRC 108236]